jgi:hypothetical protein
MRTLSLRGLAATALLLALAGCPSSSPSDPRATGPAAAVSAHGVDPALAGVLASAFSPSAAPAAPPAPPAPAASALDPASLPNLVPCPPDMAPTGLGGCIDKWEASAGPGALGDPAGKGTSVVARSKAGEVPLVDVTEKQAEKACANAKKHLCAEREWLAACQGPAKWEYSYGPEFVAKRCRDWNDSNHGLDGASRTGSYPGCVSPYGVFDLTNNVGELTATAETSGAFAVRGGTYNMVLHDSACDEDDYVVKPGEHHPDVGFRCCAPATTGGAAPKHP